MQLAAWDALHCLDRVAHQVEQNLLNLDAVRQDEFGCRIELVGDADINFPCADQGQRSGFLDQRRQTFDLPLALASRDEVAKVANDISGPQGLFRCFFDGLPQHRRVLFRALFEKPPAAFEVIRNGRERLVDFMCQRRGHFAERGKPRHMEKLLLLLLYSGFRLVAFGQVAAEAGKEAAGPGMHLTNRKFHGKGRAILAHSRHRAAEPDDPALSGSKVAVQIGVMLFAIGRRHQQTDILTEDFAGLVTEQCFGSRAEGLNTALFVDDDHCVGHRRQDRAQMIFAQSKGGVCIGKLADVRAFDKNSRDATIVGLDRLIDEIEDMLSGRLVILVAKSDFHPPANIGFTSCVYLVQQFIEALAFKLGQSLAYRLSNDLPFTDQALIGGIGQFEDMTRLTHQRHEPRGPLEHQGEPVVIGRGRPFTASAG